MSNSIPEEFFDSDDVGLIERLQPEPLSFEEYLVGEAGNRHNGDLAKLSRAIRLRLDHEGWLTTPDALLYLLCVDPDAWLGTIPEDDGYYLSYALNVLTVFGAEVQSTVDEEPEYQFESAEIFLRLADLALQRWRLLCTGKEVAS